jgi:hypothetical protein
MPNLDWPIQAAVVNGIIYVIGYLGAVYAYNPLTDSWTDKTQAPSIVNSDHIGFVTAVFDDKIYVLGLGTFELIYDPLNDTWSRTQSSMPYTVNQGLLGYGSFEPAEGSTTGMLASERVYAFFENQSYIYDPTNDTWTLGAAVPANRVDYGVARFKRHVIPDWRRQQS